METPFRVDTRKSMGNLHLVLNGAFDDNLASTLIAILRRENANFRRFFINTEKLHRVDILGKIILHAFMQDFGDLKSRIYFKGKNGSTMAMEGQKVLLSKEQHRRGCAGTCKTSKAGSNEERQKTATQETGCGNGLNKLSKGECHGQGIDCLRFHYRQH
ncbi:MAG: hypothetical protein EYX74_02445 [Desulfobulbaceae bacterium]|nr:MAG: hypothetical protein EYX74_02445 [Desulfobulbaceae bacterium]